MSFGDTLGRIGAIQETLSRISGTATASAGSVAGAAAGSVAPAAASAAQLAAGIAGLQGGTTDTTGLFNEALTAAVTQNAPAPAVSATPAEDGKVDGADVVATAKGYLGVPYVWGGNDPKIGLDCSSLVQHTFRDLGVELPRVARDQAKVGTEVPSLAEARPGDLIVTRGGAHIGIYLGDNRMIHAPRPGEKVSIRDLFETDADIMTIRRVVPAAQAAQAAQAAPDVAALAQQQLAFAGASR